MALTAARPPGRGRKKQVHAVPRARSPWSAAAEKAAKALQVVRAVLPAVVPAEPVVKAEQPVAVPAEAPAGAVAVVEAAKAETVAVAEIPSITIY
jgi:hypothetical protein